MTTKDSDQPAVPRSNSSSGDQSSDQESEGGELESEEECDWDEEEEEEKMTSSSWMSRLAILGDSGYSLLASTVLLLLAIGFRFQGEFSEWSHVDTMNDETLHYTDLGPIPTIDPPVIYNVSSAASLNETLRNVYHRDGVIAIRGLLSEDLLQQLDKESTQVLEQMDKDGKISKKATNGKQFHAVQHHLALRNPPPSNWETDGDADDVTAFLNVSLFSQIPQVAAALLLSDDEKEGEEDTNNLRLMRDIFLTKDQDPYICGWHVDDFGFWPTTADSPGINAWIALDDMPLHTGGGFALAVQSHTAPWRDQAHRAIGATTTAPTSGFTSALDLFVNRTGGGTCNLETTAPHVNKRMEETMRVYDIKRGDVIFHHRWLFHRTVAMAEVKEQTENRPGLVYRRYSLRYGPGSSVIPPGFGTEPSVLWNDENGGRTANQ
eukprot:scaffold44529_cov39-Attheya_sp.AAC.2